MARRTSPRLTTSIFVHRRGVQRERALDAHAVAQLADRVGLLQPAALAADHVALEHLDPLLAALDHADVHLELVAGCEVGDIGAQRLVVDEVGGFHGGRPSGAGRAAATVLQGCGRQGRSRIRERGELFQQPLARRRSAHRGRRSGPAARASVRWRAWARRHRAIRPWSPLRSTSGTAQPRNSAGRVNCGSSSRPAAPKLSVTGLVVVAHHARHAVGSPPRRRGRRRPPHRRARRRRRSARRPPGAGGRDGRRPRSARRAG